MKKEIGAFLRGFVYAANGVRLALKSERNLRFHCCAAAYVLWLAQFYSFSSAEKSCILLCIGGMMALELMNSAVERAVDRPDAAHWIAAGAAKDMAAGAVLVFSAITIVVGVILFWQPTVFRVVLRYLTHPVWRLLVLLATLPLAFYFIFGWSRQPADGKKNNESKRK